MDKLHKFMEGRKTNWSVVAAALATMAFGFGLVDEKTYATMIGLFGSGAVYGLRDAVRRGEDVG